MIESLALFKTDEEEIIDTTFPDVEMQESRLGDRSDQFNKLVTPTEDERIDATKRSAITPPSKVAKKQKVEKQKVDIGPVDMKMMEAFVNAKKVESLNNDKLKYFLRSVGEPVNNKKKDELVQAVYQFMQACCD